MFEELKEQELIEVDGGCACIGFIKRGAAIIFHSDEFCSCRFW